MDEEGHSLAYVEGIPSVAGTSKCVGVGYNASIVGLIPLSPLGYCPGLLSLDFSDDNGILIGIASQGRIGSGFQ